MSSRGQSGLTILELVVAISLVALGVAAAAAAQTGALALSRNAREVMTASADLASACELINTAPVSELPTLYPDGAPIPAFDGLHLPDERIVVCYPDLSTNPREVRLSITWRDAAGSLRQPIEAAVVRIR